MSTAAIIRKASDWIVAIWVALLAICIFNQAEGVVLLAVAAVPVGLFWGFGRLATRWAAYVDKRWA
jgi:hypothetical protein